MGPSSPSVSVKSLNGRAGGPRRAKDFVGLQHLQLLLRGLVAKGDQTDSEFRVLDLFPNWSHLPSLSLFLHL